MAISVLELVPARNISHLYSGLLILLLMRAVLHTIVSTNPSLEPRKTLYFSGSCTFLAGYSLASIKKALS